jgi:hypothetical protein
MTAPTLAVRRAVAERDKHRCLLCGRLDGLTFQHRRAVGAGGSKLKPSPVDGCVLCGPCNTLIEQDRDWMIVALARGIKVRRWVASPDRVPVYVVGDLQWYRLEGIRRIPIPAGVAYELMHAVYGQEFDRWVMEANS